MLDQIINLVKDQAADHIVNQTEVDNAHAEPAAQAAGESIFEAIQQNLQGGNLQDVQKLLSGGEGNMLQSGIGQQMVSMFTSKLQDKGVDQGTASNSAQSLISSILPMVVSKFASSKQEDAGFDVQGLMTNVLGNAAQDQIASLFGGAKQGGGGLLNTIGNLFGK